MIVTGVLEWIANTPQVATELEHVVPAWAVPLVPIVLGGIATTVGVHQTPNGAAASDDSPTLPASAADPVPSPATAVAAVSPPVAKSTTAAAAPAGLLDAAWWPQAGAPDTSATPQVTSVLAVPRVPTASAL